MSTRALALTGLVLAWGCGGGGAAPPEDPGDSDLGDQFCDIRCPADASRNADEAAPGTSGDLLQDELCPSGDVDFWTFTVGASHKLVSIDASYAKLASMQLVVDWLGPKGACLPSPAITCSASDPCATGFTCDAARGGCRRTAIDEECVLDSDCLDGEICAFATTELARIEGSASVAEQVVDTSVAARAPGDYTLRIYDFEANVCDEEIQYGLTVTPMTDPDDHEPNDAPNMATNVSSATPLTGYLSHRGRGDNASLSVEKQSDIDWYVIDPGVGVRPVVTIDLRWNTGAEINPTWTLIQGAWTFPSPSRRTIGTGVSAEHVRSAAVVAPATGPVYVKITNQEARYDLSNSYALTVSAAADGNEPVRDDTPGTARILALAGYGSSAAHVGRIVASNDTDWYRVDRPASGDVNALALIAADANAPDTAGYVMQLTFYRQTAAACPAGGVCANGGRCNEATNTCLALMTQRPWIDQLPGATGTLSDHGDPQSGGLTPNQITSQLPLFGSGNGTMFIEVRHNPAATASLPGYSATESYDISVTHRQELDAVDRSATPDNLFVSRPLAASGNAFFAGWRDLVVPVAGATGSSFVTIAGGTAVPASTCTPITLQAFNAAGQAATLSTTVTSPGGTLFTSCGGAALESPATITTSRVVGYLAGAAAMANTLATVTGGVTATQSLSIGVTGAIRFTNDVNGAPLRHLSVGTRLDVLRVTLPAAVTGTRDIDLSATNATIACAAEDGSPCENPEVANACPTVLSGGGSTSSCTVRITEGNSYDIRLRASAVGLVVVNAVDTSGIAGRGTYVGNAGGQSASSVGAMTGYISYEGDNDFFRITLSPASFPAGHGTIFVTYPGSRVEVRSQVTRGGAGAGLASIGNVGFGDMCVLGTCSAGGVCDARGMCTQPGFSGSAGPAASSPQCTYWGGTETVLEVWVNDVNHNDYDEAAQYSIDVQMAEGCPDLCNSFVCP